jgi:3-hydroxyisobutyrate dehydrogenase-like beta-hydroxyacid dehydrogenase
VPEPERIAFIGLGIMGKPMARHLLDAGFPLTVHSRSPGPVDELVDAGLAVGGGGERRGRDHDAAGHG